MLNQQDINAIRARRLANTHDPLALMANIQTPFHPDHSSLITYIQHPQLNNNFVPQPSFNTNYLQHPMQNPEDISNPTIALDMALELMAKAFQLNITTLTNNNQRSSSHPCYSQFRHNAMQNVGHLVGKNAVQNQARAEGNGNRINGNLIKCYNCQGEGHYASNYGSAEVHHYENCYDNDIFNMFTQEEQYTELLEPIQDPHQVQQNDNNVISEVFSVGQDEGKVEQHPATIGETCAYFEILYSNLEIKVEKVNKDEIFPIVNQVDARLQNFEIQFFKEAAKFVRDFKSLAKEADESLVKHKALKLGIERLLRAVVSQDINLIVQSNSVKDTSNLQTKLERTKERFENCIIKKENRYAKLWNDCLPKIDETHALSKPVTSNSAPSSRESTIMNGNRYK
nr:hypothetical protein [Tanacetum cinerariifolium]